MLTVEKNSIKISGLSNTDSRSLKENKCAMFFSVIENAATDMIARFYFLSQVDFNKRSCYSYTTKLILYHFSSNKFTSNQAYLYGQINRVLIKMSSQTAQILNQLYHKACTRPEIILQNKNKSFS